jgi:hypothetical protein
MMKSQTAGFGPYFAYSHRPLKAAASAAGRGGGAGGGAGDDPLRLNLVLCLARRAQSAFVTTLAKVVNANTLVHVCVLDSATHMSALVEDFASFVFSHVSAEGDPAHFAIAAEDPALLDLAVRSGAAVAMLRASIAGRNLRRQAGATGAATVHVFLANLAGVDATERAAAVCESLQGSLRATLPAAPLRVAMNSLLSGDAGAHAAALQDATWHFFDRARFQDNSFTADEQEIRLALQGKLAFVSDLRAMLTSSRLALIMGDLSDLEGVYAALQAKVLRGEVLSDPGALRDVVVLEQKIRQLLDALSAPAAPAPVTAPQQ